MRTRGEKQVLSLGLSLTIPKAEVLLRELRASHPRLILQLVTLEDEPNARMLRIMGLQTLEAMRSGALLAEKPEVDLLLRIAGTTQITEALRRVGYGKSGNKVLVAMGDRKSLLSLQRRGRFRVLKATELSQRELGAVETAALLNARRA